MTAVLCFNLSEKIKNYDKCKNKQKSRFHSYFFFPSQVPPSKWGKESEEEEQVKAEVTAQDAANQEYEQKRWRSVDIERDRDGPMQKRRLHTEQEKDSSLSSINRTVAPSSGKYRTDSTICTDRERERRMELEKRKDRERGREGERPRDRQKESKRSKEKRREEERGRYRGAERGHSSTVSVHKGDPPSSSSFSSSSRSRDTERRDWQRGSDQGSDRKYFHPSGSERKDRSSISTAVELPDKNAYKIHRDTSVDSKSKDKNHPHNYHNHQAPSRNYRHQDRPVLSHVQVKDRHPLTFESFSLKPRMSSPGWELMQNRSRNETKEEKGEWKQNRVNKVIRESQRDRQTREMEAEREGGSRWEDNINTNNKLAGESMWEGRRELEEGERSSSRSSNSSSSASLENRNEQNDRRKGRKKHKKHRKEKRQAVPELQEEMELNTHKKSKKKAERREEESGGEEEEHARLCSVTSS